MSSEKPNDPIAGRLRQARDNKEADAAATAGERALIADFQGQANKAAVDEVGKIEQLFAARCEAINAAKDVEDPEFAFNGTAHELRAGQFATYLELTEGFSPYRLDMVSGLRRDAAQVFAPGFEPAYEPTHWKLFAHMDDCGFYWDCEGDRLSSEDVVEQGVTALVDNLTR